MSRTLVAVLLLSLSLAPSLSSAFDGNRKGFMMGIGIGAHTVDVNLREENGTHGGISTSFRLGYGVSNRLLVYYMANTSWYNRGGFTALYGLSGVGASFFISQALPAFYITGGIGYATLDGFNNDVDLSDDDAGFLGEGNGTGFLFGTGLELKKHMSLEALIYLADIDSDQFDNTFNATTFQFNLNLLFY